MHQRCRFAPLSFHPWSWWDARRDSAQFSSSVHQYFFSCTHSSVQSPPVSVLLTRDRSSLCSRREIIILKQTRGFLREDHCNFLTPKHPSISLQTFYYVWNIILGLEALQEQPVGCDRSITKRKGNCSALTFRLKWKSIQKVQIMLTFLFDFTGLCGKTAKICNNMYCMRTLPLCLTFSPEIKCFYSWGIYIEHDKMIDSTVTRPE